MVGAAATAGYDIRLGSISKPRETLHQSHRLVMNCAVLRVRVIQRGKAKSGLGVLSNALVILEQEA